jgi:hypothetical protein
MSHATCTEAAQVLTHTACRSRVAYHEAGHFLIAYLTGLLPLAYTLSSLDAFRKYRALNVQAGCRFADSEFNAEVSSGKVKASSLERFACVALAGICAEYTKFGASEGALPNSLLHVTGLGGGLCALATRSASAPLQPPPLSVQRSGAHQLCPNRVPWPQGALRTLRSSTSCSSHFRCVSGLLRLTVDGPIRRLLRLHGTCSGVPRLCQADAALVAVQFTQKKADSEVRWAVLNDVSTLRRHAATHEALAQKMSSDASVSECIACIEEGMQCSDDV